MSTIIGEADLRYQGRAVNNIVWSFKLQNFGPPERGMRSPSCHLSSFVHEYNPCQLSEFYEQEHHKINVRDLVLSLEDHFIPAVNVLSENRLIYDGETG